MSAHTKLCALRYSLLDVGTGGPILVWQLPPAHSPNGLFHRPAAPRTIALSTQTSHLDHALLTDMQLRAKGCAPRYMLHPVGQSAAPMPTSHPNRQLPAVDPTLSYKAWDSSSRLPDARRSSRALPRVSAARACTCRGVARCAAWPRAW